jgi:hypothetical protein
MFWLNYTKGKDKRLSNQMAKIGAKTPYGSKKHLAARSYLPSVKTAATRQCVRWIAYLYDCPLQMSTENTNT